MRTAPIPAVAVLLLLLGNARPALAEGALDLRLQAPAGMSAGPFSGGLTLENAVGLGTFLENPDTGRMKMPYYAVLLTLEGAYRLSPDLSLRARFDVEKEITSSYATATTQRRQLAPSDLWLGLHHERLFVERWVTGITVEGDVRAYFPTSRESRYATRWLGLAGRLGLSRSLGGYDFTAGTRFTKHLARYTQPLVPDYADDVQSRPCVGLAVDGGDICGGAAAVSSAFTHDFGVAYDLTRTLTLSATLYVINRFAFVREPDALSSPFASGEGQRDLTRGILDLSYQFGPHVTYSVGISSYQPAKTEDGQRLRFPFWDLEGRAENYTSFYLDVAGTF